jgi:lipoprotein-releasing system permease protein
MPALGVFYFAMFSNLRTVFFIARRYLFAKRSTNVINLISGISLIGIAISTAALLLTLWIFNGFEGLLTNLFSHFNPELKVEPASGKFFQADSATLVLFRQADGVELVSQSLEEIAFFSYSGAQDFGKLKGVDGNFPKLNQIDSTVIAGTYGTQYTESAQVMVGAGVAQKLTINIASGFQPMQIYMPEKEQGGAMSKPFKTRLAYPQGVFSIQQDFDNEYILADIEFVRELLELPNAVSSLELKLKPGSNAQEVKKALLAKTGNQYIIRDRYEQNEAFFKVMRLEKWLGYAVTSLILILMAFNLVGALWMIVIEKERDIATYKSFGTSDQMVKQIFIFQGLLLTGIGLFLGFLLAFALYFAQKQYGLISVPPGFLVSAYPIEMRWSDFIPVSATVLLIGYLATLLPAWRTQFITPALKED